LLVNSFAWSLGSPNSTERQILKHVYSKKDKRCLSIKELLTRDWETKVLDPYGYGFADEKDYVRIENGEGEISRAVLEYMDFLSNNDLSLTSKQREFLEYQKMQIHSVLEHNQVAFSKTHIDDNKMIERYKIAARMEAAQATLCAGLLEEDWQAFSREVPFAFRSH
jgi:hypothetical protein